MQRRWRYVRASLITFVLLLGFVSGWPHRIPKMVGNWPAGWAVVALRVPALQQELLAPFAPLADALDLPSEDWRLFTGTGGTRYRMWIEGRGAAGGWQLFYRAHDPRHDSMAGALEYRRVLNVWNPHHGWIASSYPEYARWLARKLFHEHDGLREVRVRMEEGAIEPRGAGFSASGHFAYEEVVRRDEVTP